MKRITYQLDSEDGTLSGNGDGVCYAGEHNATELVVLRSDGKYADYQFMFQFHTPDCQSPRFAAKLTTSSVISLWLPAVVMQAGEVKFDLEAIRENDDGQAELVKVAQGKFTVEPAITNGKLYNDKYYDEIYLLEQEYLKLKNNLMTMIDNYLKEKYAELDSEAEVLRAKLEASVNSLIANATAKLEEMNTDFEHFMTNADISVKALIAQANDKFDTMNTDFEHFITNADIDVKAVIAQCNDKFKSFLEESNKQLEEMNTDFEHFMTNANIDIKAFLAQAEDKLSKFFEESEKRINELIDGMPEQIRSMFSSGEFDEQIKNVLIDNSAVKKVSGDSDNPVIISELGTGIYSIEGNYRAAPEYEPLFASGYRTSPKLYYVDAINACWYEFNGKEWSRWTWSGEVATTNKIAVCDRIVNIDTSLGRLTFADYTPTADTDLANKKYVDDIVGDINTILATVVNGGDN